MSRDEFVPASPIRVKSGTHREFSHLILCGILNGLVLALSHILYAIHSVAGLFALSFFHQAIENLFLATIYILMILKIPQRPLFINGAVWGLMGLMMGFWPILPVAVPAGIIADGFITRWGASKRGVILAGYTFYATMLAIANGWPLLLLKGSNVLERTAEMDPFFSGLINLATAPLFFAQVGASFVTALVGGSFALVIIKKHFQAPGVL